MSLCACVGVCVCVLVLLLFLCFVYFVILNTGSRLSRVLQLLFGFFLVLFLLSISGNMGALSLAAFKVAYVVAVVVVIDVVVVVVI